jgi:adenine/guanine phosphoribosyltransferase-like PRPP-binding protein
MRAQVHGSDEIRAAKKGTVRIESFAGAREFAGRQVLLVDDVLHSGATALACCEFIVRSGAAAVYFAALLQDTFEVEDPISLLPCPVVTTGSVNAWVVFPWEPSNA